MLVIDETVHFVHLCAACVRKILQRATCLHQFVSPEKKVRVNAQKANEQQKIMRVCDLPPTKKHNGKPAIAIECA